MLFELLRKGLIIGLLVSLPLGPLAVLVIQRTANRNFKSGFYTGLGVAFADSIWALIAGFSVSYIITFLRQHQTSIQIIGAFVLMLLGLYIFNSHPLTALKKFKRKGTSPMQCFGSAMLIAFSNPMIVLAYIAVFASAKVVFEIHHLASPLVFTTGFMLGASSWWLVVTYSISRFRHHFNLRILWWFNKLSGAAIILFVLVSTIIVLIKGNPSI